MLIAYDTAGSIVATSGTNSAYPDGPDDATGWLTAVGQSLSAVQVLRLHDSREAELVDLVLQGRAKVRNGRIVEVEAAPPTSQPPTTPPQQPSIDDLLAQIQTLQAQQAALQEQSDQLTMIVGGLL